VANAGEEMRSAERVAEMLTTLRKNDPTVLGVLGLVESRTWTQEALRKLKDTHLPVIAPTLSADHIGDEYDKYLQISPPNLAQAELVHSYSLKIMRQPKLFNFYTHGSSSKDTDLYVKTLREDLRQKFAENYEEQPWNGDSLASVCKDKYTGVVFFGGRYSNFSAFLNQLAKDCNGQLPVLVGDDSVNRFMANESSRRSVMAKIPLAYVSKGSLAFCDRLKTAPDSERQAFLKNIQEVLHRCENNGDGKSEPVGERVGLAYDATRILVESIRSDAIQQAGTSWDPSKLTPEQLYRKIVDDISRKTYLGVTGKIKFDRNTGIVNKEKHLAILCAPDISRAFETDGDVPRQVSHSGADDTQQEKETRDSTCSVR
jgi:ABC-type branched-subunit amino acid transport system substrate-binding protein